MYYTENKAKTPLLTSMQAEKENKPLPKFKTEAEKALFGENMIPVTMLTGSKRNQFQWQFEALN